MMVGGGAPMPPHIYWQVKSEMEVEVHHGVGMAECLMVDRRPAGDSDEQLTETSGKAVGGCKIRIVGFDGTIEADDVATLADYCRSRRDRESVPGAVLHGCEASMVPRRRADKAALGRGQEDGVGWFEERAGLTGKVAVVTGGAGGLGEAIVMDLAANGVRVAVLDKDSEAAAKMGSALSRDAADAIVEVGDARRPEELTSLFDQVETRWGRLDILVSVVGGTFHGAFADSTPKGWDALLRTNLTHVLHASSLAIPLMRAGGRGGSIVNITTIEAHRGAPNFAVYSAAKAAVAQFAKSLAVELAADGIRVNNVAPDLAPTPNMERLARGGRPLDDPVAVKIAIPMGRVGTVNDVSNCVVFLASELSSYVTGTTIHPDGGTLASSGWFNWPGGGYSNTVPSGIMEALGGA